MTGPQNPPRSIAEPARHAEAPNVGANCKLRPGSTLIRQSRLGRPRLCSAFVASAIATVVSALLGVGSGILLANIAAGDNFSMAGLAVAPLWLLLEIVFELIVGVFGSHARFARIAVTTALLIGFYSGWFFVCRA